jgi:predicted dehydrogenase
VERSTNHAAERYPGITTYRTLEGLLEDDSLNLTVLATPTGNHFELARQILEAGKNLVVDKPMAVEPAEIAQLMELATSRGVLLCPFHNRRWDSDFRTIENLLHEASIGRLVYFESNFDRWIPVPRAGAWREKSAPGGGMLLDLGTHLADQALVLFGKPEAVSAEVLRERGGEGSDDSFTLRLRYENFRLTLGANCLSALLRPRFHLRGMKGNYWKWGLDPQEAVLREITRIGEGPWGEESAVNWGKLAVDVDGSMVTRPIRPIPGDYRLYYAGIRDALLGKAAAPVTALDAWRAAQVLEWALASAKERREIACDWSDEPK